MITFYFIIVTNSLLLAVHILKLVFAVVQSNNLAASARDRIYWYRSFCLIRWALALLWSLSDQLQLGLNPLRPFKSKSYLFDFFNIESLTYVPWLDNVLCSRARRSVCHAGVNNGSNCHSVI
ncbi:hypothetical protein EV361DRAFT_512975 [Lentinula raphanica]|uniref:Uncharacterized protein n=1 Tax=Lentinula raphanica TaxID=153919 RepID=A0AA38P004_9AGAR|nr:hypothetical protein F5880DRAFT_793219 [Lentinula raphanica]KAJ3833778.1 hypothetical protein F5878DRAFT_393257 [Lentinula raphanica]KAJ3967173.1 hypothetical protein EV361DRAFT_512975 [Lentinula raphanica]